MRELIIEARSKFFRSKKGGKVDSTSDLYDLIVRQLPQQIRQLLNSDVYRVKGSIGQGNMTTHPWVSIINPNITTTTQEGLYVVILFNASFSAFYVSLNQGITYFDNKYKSRKYEYASKMARYFRHELGMREGISYEPIDLEAKRGSLAYGYEQTNIASKRFEIENFNEKEFESVLNEFISLYEYIVSHMRPDVTYNDLAYSILFEDKEAYVDADEALKNIKAIINKEKRSLSGIKQKMQLMVAGKERSQKFRRMTMPIIKKTDWIEKAREDAITGLVGEELVIEHEQERLTKLGLYDEAEKIKHMSIVSDTFGYDIKSFDLDENGKVVDLFIEVKATTLSYDSEFFVTRNELEKSKQLNKNYAIYRIYNSNDVNPKYYVAKGPIEDNFFLDPLTYTAKYKYELSA